MYLSQGFRGGYSERVFRMLVFHPRHRLMHCRKWKPEPCWETPTPPRRPTIPWQYSKNFRTGYGWSSPYAMRKLWANERDKKRGPYVRDTYRARVDASKGYLSEHVRKIKPGRRRPSMFYPA